MTTEEREQFASVIVSSDGQSWLVDVAGKVIDGNPFRDIPWVERVAIINAAFNARVDAEVKKSVEEFRSRSIDSLKLACVDCCGDGYVRVSSHGCNGDDRICLTTCPIEGLAECRTCGTTIDLILSLPTEPGKGE